MSIQGIQGLFTKSNKILSNLLQNSQSLRNLSRRSNNVESPYKVIKSRKRPKDEGSLVWRDPNFEILASPSGFPFFLPGNVSPAWYDKRTTIQTDHSFIMEQIDAENVDHSEGNIICRVQECPAVLRQTVYDLFPNNNLEIAELSVVTIMLKPDKKVLRRNREIETEKLAQTFVLTANNICDKLRRAGYWADFINPFSGRPYLFPVPSNALSKTDERFRCLDFQIFEFNDCKVISIDHNTRNKNKFVGSLFTNAPSNKYHLNNIFTK